MENCLMNKIMSAHSSKSNSFSTGFLIKLIELADSMKISHPMPPSQRRSKDLDVSSSMDEERPPSRDHRGPPPRDDRYRHASHRPYDNRKPSGYYDDYNRGYKDYEYEERHPRDSWERERHYDDKGDNRETRDTRDVRDNRHISDSRDVRERDSREIRERDGREKKDYDTHVKVINLKVSDETSEFFKNLNIYFIQFFRNKLICLFLKGIKLFFTVPIQARFV